MFHLRPELKMDGSTALSIYREEKARALQERRISHAQLMTEAKEAFAKMLADAQLARKGGRPKNNPGSPAAMAAAAALRAKAAAAAAAPPAPAPVVAPLPLRSPKRPVVVKAAARSRRRKPKVAAAKKAALVEGARVGETGSASPSEGGVAFDEEGGQEGGAGARVPHGRTRQVDEEAVVRP